MERHTIQTITKALLHKWDDYVKIWNDLVDASAPWVYKSVEKFDVEKFGYVESESAPQLVEISGLCMKDSPGFYQELSRAFSFPAYSGHNLNALFDSLTDLVCITESGLLLVVHDADAVLEDEPVDSLHGFVDTLSRSGQDRAQCISNGTEWDRPAIPFNSLFEIKTADSRDQYTDIKMLS